MKKLLAVLLTLVMVLMSLAFCEASGEEWICPNCGKTNTTNFCTSCGTKRDVWICPSCGTENSDAFCGNCGSPKPIDARPETPAGGELTTEGTGSIKVGDIVTFGRYPQTAEGTDQTPIEWIVLDYDETNHKALLLSRYGLVAKPYNTERTDITWEKCTLRTWLNGEFLNKAFSAGEQSAILITKVDNSASQGYSEWDTDGGNNTEDRIFLLSYAEANRYLGVTYGGSNNTGARVAPTAYAIANGADTSYKYQTADGEAAGWWLLRSPGRGQGSAAHVEGDGSLYSTSVSHDGSVVRPAFWLNLNSDMGQKEPSPCPMDGEDDRGAQGE